MIDTSIFKNKRAFISGASGAIGGEIAQVLAQSGANLIMVSRTESDLQEKKEQLMYYGVSIDIITGDLSNQDDIIRIIDEAQAIGSVDIVINSAGIFPNKPVYEMTFYEYNEVMNINLNSVYMFSVALSESMKQNKWGRIVNIGSSSSYGGFKNTVAYCISKHGVLGLSRALHDELKDDDIRVYCVSPSSTKGKMGLATMGQDYSTFIEPKEVADYVMFVMSYDGNAVAEEVFIKRMVIR